MKKKTSNLKIDNNFIQELKAKVKIEDVVSSVSQLKHFGKNYFTSCPFCQSKQSLSISPEKQFAYCFSCGESFDVFGFFQKVKGLTFVQAVIEVKKIINSKNDFALKKLLRASICLSTLIKGINPIDEQVLASDSILLEEKYQLFFTKFDSIISFMIADFNLMSGKKELTKSEIDSYLEILNLLISLTEESKLKNLFLYLKEICSIIAKNNFNLGGIVYDL